MVISQGKAQEVFVSNHPLIQHKLSLLRDINTEPKRFREVVHEITILLAYEATADLTTREITVQTPLTQTTSRELEQQIGLVPILRSGLGMVGAMLTVLPTAQVWHLGLYRDHKTLQPITYYNKLPGHTAPDLCLVLDPMLATGGSAVAAINILKEWGTKRIKFMGLIGAPEGVALLRQHHPDVPIYIAALDDHLNDIGYIVPGLGDAGDRQFGTGQF
ncbi:MAG: uracil phosphoribosyltransferase [Chloroflexota bacterium]|nr:uracil phosphoribosyltransferase [Chloroflexota bacterium]